MLHLSSIIRYNNYWINTFSSTFWKIWTRKVYKILTIQLRFMGKVKHFYDHKSTFLWCVMQNILYKFLWDMEWLWNLGSWKWQRMYPFSDRSIVSFEVKVEAELYLIAQSYANIHMVIWFYSSKVTEIVL